MRALFLLLDGATNASSYHRAIQYFPFLRQSGIEPVAGLPVPEPAYQRLIEGSGRRRLASRAAFYGLFLLTRFIDVVRSSRADVVVIQRDLFPFGPPLLERLLLKRNTRLVYDTDDAVYLRPGFTPETPFQRLRRFDKVAETVASARWVSVATEPIARWARAYNPRVTVVPMSLDVGAYAEIARQPRAREGLVLGWAGTAGGLGYLEELAPILRRLCSKYPVSVHVISGGYDRARLPGIPLRAVPWKASTFLSHMARFDIGVVPLDDTPFEQAKFPFKLLQYLALGVPAVSARVGVAREIIRHGENGLLAATPTDWLASIEALIHDASLRRRLAAAGRDTVASHYAIERVAPVLVEGLKRAAS